MTDTSNDTQADAPADAPEKPEKPERPSTAFEEATRAYLDSLTGATKELQETQSTAAAQFSATLSEALEGARSELSATDLENLVEALGSGDEARWLEAKKRYDEATKNANDSVQSRYTAAVQEYMEAMHVAWNDAADRCRREYGTFVDAMKAATAELDAEAVTPQELARIGQSITLAAGYASQAALGAP